MIRLPALIAIAVIFGVAGEFAFRRLTDASKLRGALDKMIAHALEIPLFFDEPAVVWRAQRALIADNLRVLRLIALPCVAVAILFAAAFHPMDRYLGRRPLAAGESAVIIMPRLPLGFVAESPAVHVARTNETSWRVKALTEGSDRFPYNGPRAPWLAWFALVSIAAGTGIRLSR